MRLLLFKFLFVFFCYSNLSAKIVTFNGLSKLSLDDIQEITSLDIYSPSISDDELNIIIKELYSSDLIANVDFLLSDNNYLINIIENYIVQNIYINGNYAIKDNVILESIKTKSNLFVDNNHILSDQNTIRNLYRSLGYNETSVNIISESYSNDKVNIIFQIEEGKQSKLVNINFIGNNNFSDKYLGSIISSKSNNFYNIFTSGSNLNKTLFSFDVSKLESFYKDKGFFDIKVTYTLYKNNFSNYTLNFNVDEGNRYKLNNIIYNHDEKLNIKEFKEKFLKKLLINNEYFDIELIEDNLEILNKYLLENGYTNDEFSYQLQKINKIYELSFNQEKLDPFYINNINIYGNSITKDKTIRSKITFEPGDIYSDRILQKNIKKLNRLKYINNVSTKKNLISINQYDLDIDINENIKTGNFLFGGSFSGDTGLGFGINIKDYNILGSGNELDSSFNINSEKALFKINYITYSNKYSNFKNSYSISRQDNDLSDSFGYNVKINSLGYSNSLEINEKISISTGISFEQSDGYSGLNNNEYIADNIGTFNNLSFNIILDSDFTNDFLYPTDGISNRFSLLISPDEISDEPYYKITLKNEMYFQLKNSKNFFFTSNNFGLADSLEGKLKTKNAFSLGGLNFKGFDYRGIGPLDNDVYLGGNKFFTSSIGYGSSFIFDKQDNINIKLFLTAGSIWDSDYSSNNEFDLRLSGGLSFDVLTAVGPLSISYAIPIEKSSSDKTREFNFTIGTSF